MVAAAFAHDLGKVFASMESHNGQLWAILSLSAAPTPIRSFSRNILPIIPDMNVPEYQTLYGIYEPNCGLDKVHMSWGHDAYIAHVMKPYLPEEALYMLRYHSFYAAHQHEPTRT